MSSEIDNEEWTMIIRPKKHLLDLNLGDLWRYRDLVYLFVRRDFVAQFKQTILGPLWFIIQPLITTIMFTIVFGNIANISTDGLPKILFYMSGTVIWGYFAQVLTATSSTFTANAGIFGKVYFPRLAVPISVTLSALMKFSLQILFFFCFYIYYLAIGTNIQINSVALLFPILVLLMAVMAVGMGLVISSLTTKYRDLTFLLGFCVQLGMYASPVIYPSSALPEKWAWVIQINPMTSIIETFRYGFLGQGVFSWIQLGYSAVFATFVLALGIIIFNKVEQSFMDTV